MRKPHKRKTDDRLVILKHENDYVERIEGTDWDTVKMHFVFTRDRSKAKQIPMSSIFPHQATTSIGSEWTKGFSRGEMIFI